MQNIIEIKNATVYHGKTRVFNRLTLEIPRGCNTAISENLSCLFDTPIQLVHLNGFYQAMPAPE